MKNLVFDTGPVINLAMNNLLWILKPMKERFKGSFYITESVRRECIERPLAGKKFKYEALETLKVVQEGTIEIFNHRDLKEKTNSLLEKSNRLFRAHGNYIKNVQYAEVETIVASQILESEAVVIDEFITRALLENPLSVKDRMEKKFHQKVEVDNNNLSLFQKEIQGVKVIRTIELVTVAYELGIFKDYYLKIDSPKKNLLDGLLWAVKINGCSATEHEINEVKRLEGF